MSAPVKLGLAGGRLWSGFLWEDSATCPSHCDLYHPLCQSYAQRYRAFAISFVPWPGSGGSFFETLMEGDGLLWVGLGFVVTVVPVIIMGVVALRVSVPILAEARHVVRVNG